MKKKGRIFKRYIFLIILAMLPFYKFYHEGDYCFGDKDLVVIGFYIVLFIIAFLVIFFNNLYGISLKKELFNFRPIIIFVVFVIALLLFFKYHTKNILKTQKQHFVSKLEFKDVNLFLYEDETFQLNESFATYNCYYKGTFRYEGDSLFLIANTSLYVNFETMYQYKPKEGVLIPKTSNKPVFKEILK